jgi:hypothetical protein
VSETESTIVDTDEFVSRGWVRVQAAVPHEIVRGVREVLHQLVPSEPSAPWKIESVSVYELPVLVHAISPRLREAVDVLVGPGRWHVAGMWGFPTRFSGSIDPLWHVDGDWFHHRLASGQQILTPIFFWDTVGPDDRADAALAGLAWIGGAAAGEPRAGGHTGR